MSSPIVLCRWSFFSPISSPLHILLLLLLLFITSSSIFANGKTIQGNKDIIHLHQNQQQNANSPEIVDVLIVNPSFSSSSSFNDDGHSSKLSNRELLLRSLQLRKPLQKQQRQLAFAPTRSLRPYNQPVPKAKAIPSGPILASTKRRKEAVYFDTMKGAASNDNAKAEQIISMVNSQSTDGLREEQGRLHLVNGGGDRNEEKNGGEGDATIEEISNMEYDDERGEIADKMPRDKKPKPMHSHEAQIEQPESSNWPIVEPAKIKIMEENNEKKNAEKKDDGGGGMASFLISNWALKTSIKQRSKTADANKETTTTESPEFSFSLDSQPAHQMKQPKPAVAIKQQQQQGKQQLQAKQQQPQLIQIDNHTQGAKTFGLPQKWVPPQAILDVKKSQQFNGATEFSSSSGDISRPRQFIQTIQKLSPPPPQNRQPQPPQTRSELYFYYTPSQTTVNQDFAFAPDTPGLVCAYGMPIPVYNTPRKRCMPTSPLCGLAFTCLMDVHAVDYQGQSVDNWWTLPTGNTHKQPNGPPKTFGQTTRQFGGSGGSVVEGTGTTGGGGDISQHFVPFGTAGIQQQQQQQQSQQPFFWPLQQQQQLRIGQRR